jgi:methyl-accepting chemotaxis protein
LASLFACTLAGVSCLAAAAYLTIESVKINGPLYNNIILEKDLTADILPPPSFIIESYLITHELADTEDPQDLQSLLATARSLQDQYLERHAYWSEHLPKDEKRTALLVDAHAPAMEFFRIRQETFLPAVRSGDNDLARQIVDTNLKPLFESHREQIDRVVALAAKSAKEQEAMAASEMTSRMQFIWTTFAAVIAAVSLISWLITRSISKPISIIVTTVRSLATGDLRVRVAIADGGELGELAQAVNQTAESISGLIGNVVTASGDVAAAATEIAASAEQMASGLASQEAQTTQVSSAINEMSHSVAEVVQRSNDCASASRDSQSEAEKGGQVVHETVDEIRHIAADVSQSATLVTDLGLKSEAIGEIVKVINDIADQTNLLALNAAIEAARAGEHGRGFAVVADEVRKLAERTQSATEEVAGSIREIQAETTKAVHRIETGSDRVQRGVSLATNAGEALGRIVQSSHHVLGMVNAIAAAAQQQAAASEQIAQSVESINAITRESNEGASQAAMAANLLSQQAEALRSMVGQFKV